MLTEPEQTFIQRRTLLIRWWKWVGTALLLGVIAFWIYMFIKQPLLFNPFHVMGRIESGNLDGSTLLLMAVIGSLGFLTCGFMLICIIIFLFAAMANERKYLKIIDRLRCHD